MRPAIVLAVLAFPLHSACAQEAPAAGPATEETAAAQVPDEEIFIAAGFNQTARGWEKCGDDSGSPSYTPGSIDQRGDFNGDGQPDAIVSEGGTFCFGNTGSGYTLVSRSEDGTWAILSENIGLPHLLEEKGADGWPDIEVGGPGFCFPVLRWNGNEYALNRSQYEGRPCTP